MVWSGPRRSSAAKSTAYDTDMVEPLVESGRLTLNADASDEQTRRPMKSAGLWMEWGR